MKELPSFAPSPFQILATSLYTDATTFQVPVLSNLKFTEYRGKKKAEKKFCLPWDDLNDDRAANNSLDSTSMETGSTVHTSPHRSYYITIAITTFSSQTGSASGNLSSSVKTRTQTASALGSALFFIQSFEIYGTPTVCQPSHQGTTSSKGSRCHWDWNQFS